MPKRKNVDADELGKKVRQLKSEWLSLYVETTIPSSSGNQNIQLGEIFVLLETGAIKCKICAESKVGGEFSVGKKWNDWKLDYLKRHISHKIHVEAVNILRARLSGGVARLLTETQQVRDNRSEAILRTKTGGDKIKILIDNVILAIKMNASMNSIQEINNHLAKYVEIPENWRSKNYAYEFVECINHIIHQEIFNEIRKAQFHCLIVDDSTDISVHKMLIIYIKYRFEFNYKTVFVGIIQLNACDGKSIVESIKYFYKNMDLDLQKMVMLTSDGAALMLGAYNGVTALLTQEIYHLTAQHCVAHREDLGIDDAWTGIPVIAQIETLLRTVYTMFHRSSVKKHNFEEMATLMDCEVLMFRPLNEIRWLSRHFAIIPLIRNYDVLIEYCKEKVDSSNVVDPIAKYCLTALKNNVNRITLIALNDVFTELTKLSKYLQKSVLSPMEAHQYCKSVITKLRSQYLGDTIYWSEDVKKILEDEGNNDMKISSGIIQFIEKLCHHLDKRFPDADMDLWNAFDQNAIVNTSDFNYGNESLKKLILKYRHIIPDMDTKIILNEYKDLKYLFTEKFKSNGRNFNDLLQLVLREEDSFKNIKVLIDICGTFQASSADCERGFSLMNSIKTKSRNRLDVNHLCNLIRIKSHLMSKNTIDLDKVYHYWKQNKDRREKK